MDNRKRQLMYAIQMYGFYLYELQLYLDTHPTCPNGLAAFRKYKALMERAKDMYVKSYGPVIPTESNCDNVFEWANGPWPWEKEAN